MQGKSGDYLLFLNDNNDISKKWAFSTLRCKKILIFPSSSSLNFPSPSPFAALDRRDHPPSSLAIGLLFSYLYSLKTENHPRHPGQDARGHEGERS